MHHRLVTILTVLLMQLARITLCMGVAIAVEPIDPVQEVQRLVDVYTMMAKEAEATGVLLWPKEYPPFVAAYNELEMKLRGQPPEVTKAAKAEMDKRLWPVIQDYAIYVSKKQAEEKAETKRQAEQRKQGYKKELQQRIEQAKQAEREQRYKDSAGAVTSAPPSVDLDEGLSAFEKGNYDVAYRTLLPLSDAGIAMAQNTLGRMYLRGRGVPQDDHQALLLFRKAASQGLPNAKNNIGTMYVAGRGVKQDFQQAVAWYLEAAHQGFPLAMDNLADMYAKGFGVMPDQAEASRWRAQARSAGFTGAKDVMHIERVGTTEYQKALEFYYQWKFAEAAPFFQQAAEKGHPEAQLILGALYHDGQGVQKDKQQAQYWTQEAAKQGHHMKDNRDRVVIHSSKERIEEIDKTRSSPPLPVCACGRDIPPQECAHRFSCRVP